jgi:5-methylcytosine-specific restriction protein A
MCKAEGRIEPATIANHKVRHKGDPELFWHGELNSMCKRHHDSDQQRIEKGGKPKQPIGRDGWPTE